VFKLIHRGTSPIVQEQNGLPLVARQVEISAECQELGMNHFEGRSWRGFHHHACLVMLAYGFLVLEQLREKEAPASPGRKSGEGPRITVPAIRRALQQLLRPMAKPDCKYCNPYYHLLIRRSQILTE
jgi:hypothetical protein